MLSGRGPWKQALLTCRCHFCHQHPCQQAQIRGPSPYHLAKKTLLLQPFPPVDEIYNTFGKENKRMRPGQLVKSIAEKTRIKLQVRVCAKDWEFLGYSRPVRRRKNNSVCVGSGEWYWMCVFIVLTKYPNKRSLPKLSSMFLSIKLHCFNQRERADAELSEKENLNTMHNELPGAKTVIFNAKLSWPFQGEQQLASPAHGSWITRLFLRICPTYRYKSTESIFYLGGNCSLGGLRLTHVLPRDASSPWQGQVHCFQTGSSQQFSNFILSNSFYWQAPQLSPEVISGVGEWKERTAPGVSPLPRGQLHSTLYPRSALSSPPSPAQLWLPHILDRGHFPEKYNGIFKTTSNTECQPNVASVPTAFTIWVQCPLILPGGSPAFFQLLLTMIPFLHVIPSSHQKLGYHDPKWSLLQSLHNSKAPSLMTQL